MMIRTFHPVGQGAFYSERHNALNIVYDCGTMAPRKARAVVEDAFKDEVIDVLFISHFDKDHISSIPDLKNSAQKIRAVVLPLLNNQQRNFLLNFYSSFSADLVNIITNPESYFGSDTNIIRVRATTITTNVDRRFEDRDLRELINNNSNESIEIESGTPLTITSTAGIEPIRWCFVPYNYEDKIRRIEVDRELNKVGISTSKLMNDPNYTLSNLANTTLKNKIKNIYDKLQGKINENSMLLYSGPDLSNNLRKCQYCHLSHHKILLINSKFCYTCLCMSGCIYTGDSDFKCFKLKDIYAGYVDHVDVIQIPHHGSKYDFDLQALEGFSRTIMPVSHRTTSSKHPDAEVVKELTINGFHVISINENTNSEFRQFI
ncbi:hypothetical protein [Psychrobacter sp. NPDC078631]|uniref:hypothetical protein n=1 Tax=Psychrobacter sp. NPDC078631 TaxID=3390666 RepID=UPI003D091AC2